jgi:citronellyl-CoA dehydrogenase
MLMTFFGEEHESWRGTLRAFVLDELAPHADEWRTAEDVPRSVFARMGKLGFLGPRFPRDVGGAGGDFWHSVVLGEEIVRSRSAALSTSLLAQSEVALPLIGALGTVQQKEEFLVPAIRGEKIGAFAVAEPDAGLDLAGIRTSARRVGQEFVVDGVKSLVVNGSRADYVTLAARTGGGGDGGISLLLVPSDTKGFSLRRRVDGGHGEVDLCFEGCRIPQRYLLGGESSCLEDIGTNLEGERLVGAVAAVAGARQALDDAVAFGRERQSCGRPLLSFQVWRHAFADLYAQVEAVRWLAYRACDLFNRGMSARQETTMAKLLAADLAAKIVDRCLQFHGGFGPVEERTLTRVCGDVRLATVGGETPNVMRELLARSLGIN